MVNSIQRKKKIKEAMSGVNVCWQHLPRGPAGTTTAATSRRIGLEEDNRNWGKNRKVCSPPSTMMMMMMRRRMKMKKTLCPC
jgi:hypothetical protein